MSAGFPFARDDGNIIMLIHSIEAIKGWQMAAAPVP